MQIGATYPGDRDAASASIVLDVKRLMDVTDTAGASANSQRIHDLVPDAGAIVLRQVASRRTRTQSPKGAIEHATVVISRMPRGLFGSIGLMAVHI
jgi:hypothetical protein